MINLPDCICWQIPVKHLKLLAQTLMLQEVLAHVKF